MNGRAHIEVDGGFEILAAFVSFRPATKGRRFQQVSSLSTAEIILTLGRKSKIFLLHKLSIIDRSLRNFEIRFFPLRVKEKEREGEKIRDS